MCCICDESTLTDHNTYWYPNQWKWALERAIAYGQKTQRKQRLTLHTFRGSVNGPIKGWIFEDVE